MRKLLLLIAVAMVIGLSACKEDPQQICGYCEQTTIVVVEGWSRTEVTTTEEFCGDEYQKLLANPDSVTVNLSGLVRTSITYDCD